MRELENKYPTEIELAAKKLGYLASGALLSNVLYGYPSQKRLWWLAAQALREQAEREMGCEYCSTDQNKYLTDDIYMATTKSYGEKQRVLTSDNGARYKTLGFCPMCGKRLEVERDG